MKEIAKEMKMSNYRDYVKLVGSIDDVDLLEDFLIAVTTPSERKELVRRVQIVQRLLAGDTHFEIADNLHVGVSTVTRASKELAQGRFKALRKRS